MPTRRPFQSYWKSPNRRKRQPERVKRRDRRRPLLEALEQRQLLAVGPQLAGIQPDEGALLRNGDIRQISPRELKFQFNDGAMIDPSTLVTDPTTTLGGIRLTRSNSADFAVATATSDFNTNGQVVIDFRARRPGTSGNDIRIEVIKNAAPTTPLVSVVGGVIKIELNTTTGTTASGLVSAINNHPQAGELVTASIRRGPGTTNISQPAITYSPIVTSGANAASVVTDLGVGTSLQMKLTATQPGPAGLDIVVQITRRDFGGVAPPRITVVGREVSIEVNSNVASPTTAGQLVKEINANVAARALITASLPIGNANTLIGNRNLNLRLMLVGVADIPVVPGFIGLGDSPREVVMRFSEPLPDAFYHVEIVGSGPNALRDENGAAFGDTTDDNVDDGSNFGLTFQLDLGAQILAIVPQPVTRNAVTNILTQARQQINVYFNDDDLSPSQVVDPTFYQLIFTNNTVQNTDDVIYHPIRVQYDAAADMVALVFASDIEDLGSGSGKFRLRIGTNETLPLPPLRTISQSDEGSSFATAQAVGLELEVTGNGTTLVDSQTLTLTGRVGGAAAPTTITFEFVDTALPGTPAGTNVAIPFDSSMDQATVVAAIAAAINQTAVGRATVDGSRIALTGTLAAATGAGVTAVRVEQLRSLVVSSQIEAKPYNLEFPGGLDEPGHRQISEEAHVVFGADSANGITTLRYNFRTDIGTDPADGPLFNVITEAQKQRAREIFHIYGEFLGVQFIETDIDGLTVATGDMRAISAVVPTGPNDGVFYLADRLQDAATGNVNGLLILDNAENWDDGFGATDNPVSRHSWFEHAMQGIGTLLGLGNATELPPVTIMAGANRGEPRLQFDNSLSDRVYPGSADVVHGQYLYRPEGQDIDMFRVDVPETGLFSAEVIAERQLDSSLLDSVIMLFREVPGGVPELIARNDDYYSKDSYFELELTAGTYWVGVSASGNDQYNPMIEDSGFGGVTEGNYDLRLNFRPDSNLELLDATGVAVDGDGNGTPGGVHNFWFEVQDESRTIFVDKMPPANPTGAPGSRTNPYTRIPAALSDLRLQGINREDMIIRIVGNPGPDRNFATLGDNIPYEIGFNQNGVELTDGATLTVPKGVTVMIDSGAVIKSRRGRIAVGSSAPTVDRSEAALQVLGTPVLLNSVGSVVRNIDGSIVPGSVYFTSLNDDAIGAPRGVSGHPPAAPGDWGGLVFQSDIDRADANRVDVEDRGIFLNYVSNADMRYGGGTVIIDGVPQPVSPIHMTDARATAISNTISFSADAAISASPDTFEETNFHAAEYQFSPFTSEYQRVGPDLYGNRTIDNSINGLFIRVLTPAGGVLRPMTVPGRLDDRDITHVLAENLVIQGTPGGPIQEASRPVTEFVTLEAITIFTVIGDGLTVVDGDTFTITPASGPAIIFEFVDSSTGRTTTGTRAVLFDLTMDASALTTAIANSIAAAGIQVLRDVNVVTLLGTRSTTSASPVISLNEVLAPGTYNYKVVFVDANGNEGLASRETRDITFDSPQNAVRLLNLPLPTEDFVSRRIYRSEPSGDRNGPYTLVAEINGSDTFFVDDGREFAGTLRTDSAQGGDRPAVDFVSLSATTATIIQVVGDGPTVVDGETFTITPVASLPVTFEFVDSTTTRPVTQGNRPIRYSTSSSQATLASVVASAIATAGIQSDFDGNVITMAEIQSVSLNPLVISLNGGGTLSPGVYNYKIVFVDANGNEGLASTETQNVSVGGNSVLLSNLPTPSGRFVSSRIYRSNPFGDPDGDYIRVGDVIGSDTTFFDTGSIVGLTLQPNTSNLRARLDGRLAIDPGIIVKLNGTTIETRFGSQLIAEGLFGQEVIFTSIEDDTYGNGGTFDTGNNGFQAASPGDWGGLYLGHMSRGSLDHAQVSYGGGVARIQGNFTGFNVIEIHQADVRVANSAFRDNADGTGGQALPNRAGRGGNDASLIFVRGAQPIIVDNLMLGNAGPVISIDANSLNARSVTDTGRTTYNRGEGSTSSIDLLPGYAGNSGPLVRLNALGSNDINGMKVRGGTLTTESVWDDADIVHVLLDETVYIPDFHTFGGLRLVSSASQSLVVKLQGDNAGLTATGRPLDIDDRIGGSLQILGQPGHPVVLTSLADDTVGAGFQPDGRPQLDTNNDGTRVPMDVDPVGDVVTVTSISTDANALRDALLGPGVTPVGNATFVGGPASAGFFSGGTNSIGLSGGIVLTSGDASFAGGPNATDFSTGIASQTGDADLNAAFNVTTTDTTFLQFDFMSDSSDLFFNFVFGSEEYNEFVNSPLAPNDVFGFFLDGQNIAMLPGTNTPVSIATVNGGGPIFGQNPQNSQFYINNDLQDGGLFLNEVGYDGFTVRLTAQATNLAPGVHTIKLAISDVFDTALDSGVFLEGGSFSNEMITIGTAGDWRSIDIDEFANDRNVDSIAEREPSELAAPGNNSTPDDAQFLGALAPHDKAGDESLRLGFEVHGVIAEPSDYDVYSFDALAGTEVWFDIDRTSFALDTVIELINASGEVEQGVVLADPTRTVLARSDNSSVEASNPAEEATLTVRPLQKSAFNLPDRYTTNPKDAGMRVVLPGPLNSTNTYYLRVRSSSADLSELGGGLTKGVYQLQIRLGEQDEVAGTTVRYSDVRFATNGIVISGQPTHSPLLGEATETLDAAGVDTNDSFTTPEVLGNVLNTDRAALGVAGELDLPGDVDWFEFNVAYDSIQGPNAPIPRHAPLIFDLDYADGFARPNTNIWVFDENGVLVATGRDSNVADDRPAPLRGADATDLSRGSAGTLDPFIGPIELPALGTESGRYFVAVTSNAIIPSGMDQFLTALPSDPLVRLEPANSVPRIAEDHVNGTNRSNLAQGPQVPVLFDNSSVEPLRLSDMGLFVLDNTFGVSRVRMIDPFTGARENTVGVLSTNVDDVALHPNQGVLYGFSAPLAVIPNDANTGNYHQIDPRSTATTNLSVNIGDDNIETYNQDPTNAMPAAIRSGPTNAGVGVRFDAIAIGDDGSTPLSGYAIGSRSANLGVDDTRNLLYEFDPLTGTAFSAPRPDRSGNTGPNTLTQGAWTNIVEHAALDTTFDPVVQPGAPLQAARASEATTFDPITGATVSLIRDGSSTSGARPTTFTVTGGGTTRTFEFDAGPEVQVLQDPVALTPVTIRDGDVFTLDDISYEFDTGTVFVVTATAAQIFEGETFTVTSIPQNPQEFRQLTFEFSSDNVIAPTSDLAVLIAQPGAVQDVVTAVVDAINLAPQFSAMAVPVAIPGGGARISLLNEDPTNPARENAGGSFFTAEGAPGVVQGRVAIAAEESMDAIALGDAIEQAIDGSNPRGHVASSDGDRVNFRGATMANFGTLISPPRQVFRDTGSMDGTVTPDPSAANPSRTAFPVDFLAEDTADDVALEMVQAINLIFGPGTASLTGSVVQLATGFTFTRAPTNVPLGIGGIAPGGDITGLAWVGGRLYAVTGDDPTTAGQQGGGLFEVRFPGSFFADVDYVETATALAGINFTALAAGPTNLENGRYANTLFGIDSGGVLYAFDTSGIPQQVFVDGRTSVATGLFGADGLAFSNLDYNLWHVTNNRNADPGHGVLEAVDGSRRAEDAAGNRSWYFGYESPQANGVPSQRLTNPNNSFDYDFIGGAHGSLISNPFSLEGFSAADLPTLYYSYFLDTDNGSAALDPTQFMTDSFRVYVSGDDGVWHLVSTNNDVRGPNVIDEYDDPTALDNTVNPNLPSDVDADVQQNFDTDQWRQARIPLGAFAGQSNLRLRFDFDTAGGRGPTTDGVLRQNTVGDEIRAVDAAFLRDGQSFTLQTIDSTGAVNLDRFELDFGFTLVAPGGAALVEGDSFVVNGSIYIFDDLATLTDPTATVVGSVAVPYNASDSALVVANSISQTLLTNPPAPLLTIGNLTERTQPPNDTLATAVNTTLRGITATFEASGEIGDSQNLPNAFDVDLLRLELQVGDTVNVDLDANPNSPLFDGYLRVFDPNGVELAFNGAAAGPGEVDNGRDPFLSYTATVTGTHYIGVSDQSNPGYDPRSLPNNPPVPNTTRREYLVTISVDDPAGLLHQQSNRVNLPNAQTVTATGTPTGFVEGGAGVGTGFPINLHSSMSAAQVANEIALALASYCPVTSPTQPTRFCANGAQGIFQTRDEVVTVIGHTFSSQSRGPLLGQPLGVAEPLYGDRFGAFEASTNFDGTTDPFSPGALRLQDNNHEGLYLDDFIIGLAERGELVTGGQSDTTFVSNTAQPRDEIDVGPYQLEIRRAQDFGISIPPPVPTLALYNSFDTNARLGQQTTITATPGGLLWDGQTFEISDGLGSLVFEFDDDALDGAINNGLGNGVAAGHIAVPFLGTQTANEIAERIRDIINSPATQTRLEITAALADGAEQGPLGTSSTVNLFGNAIVTLDGTSSLVTTQSNAVGDSNRAREQGQVIVQSNTVRNSLGFGIIAGPGDRGSALAPLAGNLPHAGPVRVTREVNAERLAPGVVISNNLVVNNGGGGIQFSGDPNPAAQQLASMAFGRIVNNTVVGRRVGTGIEVGPNASPTLLNNIVADFTTGISVDATSNSTVVGGTLYRGNQTDTSGITSGNPLGSFPIRLAAGDDLFVDEATGNYYLKEGSSAIDSSVDSLPDRTALTLVRGPLGINPSPILAPKEDRLGQTRVDDPNIPSLPGQGTNVFKDRGAIDRADFAGPIPFLISPQDNDSLGQDSDARPTFVKLTNQTLQHFSIQLLDGVEPNDPEDGTGASDASVRSDRLTLFRDDVPLVEGVDYKFSYDATNNIIRLTPLAGIWESDHRYDIAMSNSRGFLITALDGSQIGDGDSFNVRDQFNHTVNFEFDSGYVLQVPQTLAIQIPTAGGALITDRDTITVTDSTNGTVAVFEFDLDGFVTTDNIPIPYTPTSSANEVAQAIVTAMQDADVGLSPVNHVNFGGRAVHLGTRTTHTVDLSNSPFQATGQLGGIDDGQTFIVDNGAARVTFEFTSTGNLTTGDQAIVFSFSQTNEQIAQSVAAAIGAAGLNLSPSYVALSDGLINVGGEARHFVDVSNSTLILTGTPGATPEFGLRIPTVAGRLDFTQIMDGETFTITNGIDSLTIELDDDGVVSPNDPNAHPHVVVAFTASTTVNQLANAIAIAIRDADIGLSPANAGHGIINLLNANQHRIDLTNSSFTQRGTPGVPASVAISFDAGTSFTVGTSTRVPIDTAEEVAGAITAAINSATATGRLQGVVATQQGRDVNLEGVDPNAAVIGLGNVTKAEILDVAGNALKANRDDGTTRFTITIASGLDYGDAPERYPTRLIDDGARHQASGDFTLGGSVDVDFDGQASELADGDDTDALDDETGVEITTDLVGGFGGSITVTASLSGRLDAWIDFNQDGDWNDAGEQIFASRALSAGPNVLPVTVPGNALPGNTFARFRLSSTGGLRPTGLAPDGEVEDYQVQIVGNPWHNSANPLDVDSSGFVVPLDALIVINYINATGIGPLPPMRGAGQHRVDSSGDGSATPLDVLLIVNALNAAAVQAEGESIFDVAAVVPLVADPAPLLASDVVIDQRIAVYDQRETRVQSQASRRATADDSVFSSVEGFASAVDDFADRDRVQHEDADELDDLMHTQPWESGVDSIFGDWA